MTTTSIHCWVNYNGYWSHIVINIKGFSGGSVVKNSLPRQLPGLKIPGDGKQQLYPVFLPGTIPWTEGLVAGSTWGCKRVDMTK